MKSFLKFIVLTAVVLSFDMGFAEDKGKKDSTSDRSTSNRCVEQRRKLKILTDKVDNPKNLTQAQLDTAIKEKADADEALNKCLNYDADKKEHCQDVKKRVDEINKTFGYAKQRRAVNCFMAEEISSSKSGESRARLLLSGLAGAGNSNLQGNDDKSSSNKCDVKGSKTSNSEEIEKYDKKIEDQNKEINKSNEDLVKSTEDYNKTLSDLQEDRAKLLENYEKTKSESEDSEDEMLSKMRSNQDKITEQIQSENTNLIKARQERNNIQSSLREELLKSNLQSESAIKRTCEMSLKEYYNKRYGKNSKSGSGGQAASKGASKKADVQAAYDDCYKAQRERRAQIYQNAEDKTAQQENIITRLEERISKAEAQYKQEVETYNKNITKLKDRLNKAYQQYLQKDGLIAQKIQQAMMQKQLKEAQITEKKNTAEGTRAGYENSRGLLSEDEAKEAIASYQELVDLKKSISEGGKVDGKSLCNFDIKIYKGMTKAMEDLRERGYDDDDSQK